MFYFLHIGLVTRNLILDPVDPGIVSLISAQSHNFLEIDYEIISTAILLLLLLQDGLLQKYVHKLSQVCQVKSMVRRSDSANMTIAVDLDIKNQNKQN